MKRMLLLAAAGILAVASSASAANREGQFSLSPVIGGYTYDAGQNLDTSLIYGARAGYNITKHFGVEALFDYVNTDSSGGKKDIGMYRYGGELLYHFFPDNKLVPYLAAGFAGLNFDAPHMDNRTQGAFDIGAGVKYFLNDNLALRADVRGIMYKLKNTFGDYTNSNLEYTVGAYIPFGGVKPVVKTVEPAPVPVPAPAPLPVPVPKAVEPPPAPAPPPPAVATAALTVTPVMVTKGQSATLNWKSQNATGCDIQPGIGPVPPQGARLIIPESSTSYALSCSGAGGTATSAAGVTVVVPPPPAPVVSKAAEKFCSKPAIINIQFDTDKSDIKPKYNEELKTVSDFLKEFPKAKGEISGHTDNVGGKAYNDKLSQARANSVKKYIVEKFGISADRIEAKGYGFSKPVASNKTKEGKSQNRRIEANFTCE
jgi:OOP family OmpA-OmpF porin